MEQLAVWCGQLEVCRFLKLHGADIYGYVGRQ
jgi:hypothetical protein